MIQKLWLYPPLAFARVGSSSTPCDCFLWGQNDVRPRGTGKTTIQPRRTFHVSDDGTVTSSTPSNITFKDSIGFKPVCPFFELHGQWKEGNTTKDGPITLQILSSFGLSIKNVLWKVQVANLKAFHYTLSEDDRIFASIETRGDVTSHQLLKGISPENSVNPLVPVGNYVPLGGIQLTKPSQEFPEIRLRFTPASGKVYGPINLNERSQIF